MARPVPGSVDWFDKIALRYDRSLGQVTCRRADPHVLDLVGTPSPRALLDVGCGTGRLLEAAGLRWPAASLAGADPADNMIRVARRKLPHAQLTVAAAEDLPYADASFDVVLSTTSLGHWHNQHTGLAEIRRVLRPDGRLVIADHHPLPGWIAPLFLVFGPLPGHRTLSELDAMITAAGMTVRHIGRTRSGGLNVAVATSSAATA